MSETIAPTEMDQGLASFLRAALDALPSAVLIVDPGLRIVDTNRAARQMFGSELRGNTLGNALHCLHQEEDGTGCGTTRFCPSCLIRDAVLTIHQDAPTDPPRPARLTIRDPITSRIVGMPLEVSALRQKHLPFSVIIIRRSHSDTDDPSLIPVCAACKRIRVQDQTWQSLELFLHDHFQLDVTDTICPDCLPRLYPELTSL